MPLVFPVDLAEFFEGLRITVLSFNLGEAQQSSRTRGGAVLSSRVGNRLWQGEVRITGADHRRQGEIETLIDTLREPGASFYLNDPTHQFPASDPRGTIHGDLNHAITEFGAGAGDMRQLKVSNLPVNYIGRGDHLMIELSGGRRSYHRVVTPNSAMVGAGANFEVRPFLPDGVEIGNRVAFWKPYLKAKILPDTTSGGARRAARSDPMSFRWQQTLG